MSGLGALLPQPPTDPATAKACCAALWAHPAAQLLFGPALRPGGIRLTADLVDRLTLDAGARVLDVGCGAGATLGLLASEGLRPVGVDYAPALLVHATDHGPGVAGDAERLPFAADTFDAVVIECVLSAVPDKTAALAEIRRVLRPGGGLALSDVTVNGALPALLDALVGWVACAAGALPPGGYAALAADTGFAVEAVEDSSAALAELLSQVRRRLAMLQAAAAAGVTTDLDSVVAGDDAGLTGSLGLAGLGQQALAEAADAVRGGTLGYAVLVARRR